MASYTTAAFQAYSSVEFLLKKAKRFYGNHEGDCGHHVGSKSMVAKAFLHGFYWLTAHADAEDLVKRCDACQKFSC